LTARAGFLRDRNLFFEEHPIALMPISGALPFADQADTEGFERFGQIIEAQPTQLGLLLMGLPDLPVATGFVGKCPLGVQLVAGRPPARTSCWRLAR
jgi:amidase